MHAITTFKSEQYYLQGIVFCLIKYPLTELHLCGPVSSLQQELCAVRFHRNTLLTGANPTVETLFSC